MDELRAAMAFDRSVHARGAERRIELPYGLVTLHPGLPSVYHLNMVTLDAPLARELDAAAIARLADQHLSHLIHRRIALDDAAAAAQLEPELLAAGWRRDRTVFMVWHGDRDSPMPSDPRSREISDAELRRLQARLYVEQRPSPAPGAQALVAALVDAQAALRAGTPARCFGAGEDGELYSSCTLFRERSLGEGGIAMLEDVGTIVALRERGLARAVVTCALRAALAAGCDPIVIPADADDWPQIIYSKLGFEPVGTQVIFTLQRAVRAGR
jgi:predicted N-acetyltransferase YhbS